MRSIVCGLLLLASGIAGTQPVQVPAGTHLVRIKGNPATKPVTVKPGATANVKF
jgi:hypothetical protein